MLTIRHTKERYFNMLNIAIVDDVTALIVT